MLKDCYLIVCAIRRCLVEKKGPDSGNKWYLGYQTCNLLLRPMGDCLISNLCSNFLKSFKLEKKEKIATVSWWDEWMKHVFRNTKLYYSKRTARGIFVPPQYLSRCCLYGYLCSWRIVFITLEWYCSALFTSFSSLFLACLELTRWLISLRTLVKFNDSWLPEHPVLVGEIFFL